MAFPPRLIEEYESLIRGIVERIAHKQKPNTCISDCLTCDSSTLQECDVNARGKYPVYGANGIVGYLDNYNTDGEAIYIIKDGSGVGGVCHVVGKCSATGTLNILQAKGGYSLLYVYYMLKAFRFEPYKTGMAIPHIYFKDYRKAKIYCPPYVQQVRFAQIWSAIDRKIQVERDVLALLCNQKQYLLRKMFI